MTLSFDLDDTLIPGMKRFETEPQRFFLSIYKPENIRSGTINLMKRLKSQGHKVYIYTTSYRPVSRIWWTFFFYGIRLDKVINQRVHENRLGEKAKSHSNIRRHLVSTFILMTRKV